MVPRVSRFKKHLFDIGQNDSAFESYIMTPIQWVGLNLKYSNPELEEITPIADGVRI